MSAAAQEPFFQLTYDLMCVLETSGAFNCVNHVFHSVLGYETSELAHVSFLALIHKDDITSCVGSLQLLKDGAHTVEFDARIRDTKGNYVWMCWKCHVRDASEDKIYAVARDVSKEKALEKKLFALENFDHRTGLLNRNTLFERIDQLCASSRNGTQRFSLMIIGLNEVHALNETFGSQSGDLLLQETARRLEKAVVAEMPLARIAGDQFALAVPSANYEKVDKYAEQLLRALSESFNLDGVSCAISVSIGIETASRALHSAATLMRHAEQAMKAARETSENRYCWHSQLEETEPSEKTGPSIRHSA